MAGHLLSDPSTPSKSGQLVLVKKCLNVFLFERFINRGERRMIVLAEMASGKFKKMTHEFIPEKKMFTIAAQ